MTPADEVPPGAVPGALPGARTPQVFVGSDTGPPPPPRPGVRVVELVATCEWERSDARGSSFSVVDSAILSDGTEVVLLDDRGWSTSWGWEPPDPWPFDLDDLERDTWNVLLPDDAEETGDDLCWDWYVTRLRSQGVPTTRDELLALPHRVRFGPRLAAESG